MIPQIYPYRGLDSARTTLELLPGYRLRATIEHAPLEGVTPDMLLLVVPQHRRNHALRRTAHRAVPRLAPP